MKIPFLSLHVLTGQNLKSQLDAEKLSGETAHRKLTNKFVSRLLYQNIEMEKRLRHIPNHRKPKTEREKHGQEKNAVSSNH